MSPLLRLVLHVALLAQPRDVRRRFGAEMARLFLEDVRRRTSRGASVRAAVSGVVDIVRTGVAERFAAARASAIPSRTKASAMDHLRQDLRFAMRSLLRRPAFAAMAIVTLALGVGSTTAIFSVVNGVVLRSLPFPSADRLVRLWSTDRREAAGPTEGSVSPMTFGEWRARATGFASMAMYATVRRTLTGLGEPEVVRSGRVSPEFFRVFDSEPSMGRAFTAEENLPGGPLAVVVSHGFWRERLGARPDALGTALELDGQSYTIVGIAPAAFDFPIGARFWIPVRNNASECGHGCVYMNAVARLLPGVTVARASAEMRAIADRLSEEYPGPLKNRTVELATLQDTVVGDVRPALLLVFGAVAMVLLIACANVANLLIARGASRGDEIAVRVALGAARRRVLAQMMTESVVLALLGGLLGVGLATAGVSLLRRVAPEGIPRIDEVGLDGAALLFAGGLALFTTLLFGLAPALRLTREQVAGTLRQDATRTAGVRRGIGRSALLAAEVGLSLVLLVGAGLLLRSFASLQRLDPGFIVENVTRFSVSLPGARYPDAESVLRFTDELEARLEGRVAGVMVTRSVGAPLDPQSIWTGFVREDLPAPAPGEGPSAGLRIVGADFFDVMRIPLVGGRAFTSSDRQGAPPVAIVNRRVASQFFADADPIGRQISVSVAMGFPETMPRTIVGVVEDVRWESLTAEPAPEIFVPWAQTAPSFATYLIRGTGRETLAAARDQLSAMDALLPVRDPGTMQDLLDGHTATARFFLGLIALFAVMAILLAAVGLYGVVSYVVAQRRREIGVRIALGAGRARVITLVLRQGLVPAAIGAVAGLVAAVAGARVMSSLLFGVQPTDPATLAATTTLLLAIVVAACLVPAGRAVRIPPASALRAER